MKYHKYQIMKIQSAVKCFLMVVILIITFVEHNCCYSQQSKTTSYQYKENNSLNISLSGSIKSIKQYNYKSDSSHCDTITYFFNASGYPEGIVKTDWSTGKITFIFDNGNLISENSYSKDGILYYQKKLKYNNFGKLIESSEYKGLNNSPKNTKQPSVIETYEYNSLGQQTAYTVENISRNKFKKLVYTYDSNGNKIEEGICDNYEGINHPNNCEYIPWYGYKYNERGQIIKEFDLGKWLPHNTDTYYQYDEHGNKTDVKGYYITEDTILGYHYVYEYDEFGSQIKEEEKIGNYKYVVYDHYKYSTTKYDNNRNIIKLEYFTHDDKFVKVILNRYSYDIFGNWIMKEIFEGKTEELLKREEVIYRTIEYYE